MLGSEPEKPPVETLTPETEAPAKEESTEPEPGTGQDKQQEEAEDELPEGVKKRIAAEIKKQAFFQSKIDQAVSARKAKEAEAAKVTGEPGSAPDKATEPAKNERPKRPDRATYTGTEAEYAAALDDHAQKLEAWLETRSEETIERKLTERQARDAQQKEFKAATEKHGKEFPALMDTLAETTPVEFQTAVSALEDWSGVAVHLAKNEAERKALVELFKTSPLQAIAKLGKLEDRLKPEAKPAKEETPLPKPLKPVGGDAPGGTARVDLNSPKTSFSEMAREFERMQKTG